MSRNSENLFSRGLLHNFTKEICNDLRCEVNNLSAEKLFGNDEEKLLKYFIQKYELEPLDLFETEKRRGEYLEFERTERCSPIMNLSESCRVKFLRFPVVVPFSGDHRLWHFQPNSFRSSYSTEKVSVFLPTDTTRGNLEIVFEYQQDKTDGDRINQAVNKAISHIRSNINNQLTQINQHNNQLERVISDSLKARKEELSKQKAIFDGLNIPLIPKKGMPKVVEMNVKKRISLFSLKTIKLVCTPEPGISEKTFQDILTILRFMGRTFEETPKTFVKLGEEDLRNILLAALNGYFEGDASGEVFRKKGKTDICIKEKKKGAFVAECKFWNGSKSISNALDQLLSYLTWRDCKASLVIFNNGKIEISTVLKALPKAINEHFLFVRELDKPPYDGEWKFVVRPRDGSGHEIILHIFVFDINSE